MKVITMEDSSYPERLRKIKKPPKQLYILGDESLLNGENLAIIGSRKCTEYGKKQAKKFASELSMEGINIVSGMAVGIDGIAHRACIEANGKTIAVLGSGFNHIYPKENIELFYRILETGGAVISEYAPNIEADGRNFPERNRIVSGISLGVLVVEAAYRSGTSITAQCARKQKKRIYCIPSSVESNKGVGIAKLVEKGAKLVLKPQDILKDYKIEKTANFKQIKMNNFMERQIPDKYKKIYNLINKEGIHINNIAKKLKRPIQEINQELFMMELEGFIEKRAGGYYVPKA